MRMPLVFRLINCCLQRSLTNLFQLITFLDVHHDLNLYLTIWHEWEDKVIFQLDILDGVFSLLDGARVGYVSK